jgi:hypothetical protein
MYDIIIVGGGIAGLYCAYQLKKNDSTCKILILEAEERIGGRAGTFPFHGVNILSGAGVGRKEKDKRLLSLLHDLGLTSPEFPVEPFYSSAVYPIIDLKKIHSALKKKYNPKIHSSMNFKQYATSILGKEDYENFLICSGYTDYENEDAYGTLFHYGFEDNYAAWTAVGVSWKDLIQKLSDQIGKRNIRLSHKVSKMEQMEKTFHILCENGETFDSERVILATAVDSVRNLLPKTVSNEKIFQDVQGQPFLRTYGKFSNESIPILKQACPKTVVVPGPIHKIIPMNPDKGVYMIAYTDNKDAVLLEKYSKNSEKNRDIFCRLIEIALDLESCSLSLLDMEDFYWPIGTHYYKPLHGNDQDRIDFIKKAQYPSENLFIIGEMISLNQGWVEGALESVENILPFIL